MVIRLELDANGWVAADDLLAALRTAQPEWAKLSAADLSQMIAASDKQRHEIRQGTIRALYGHSVPGKLQRQPGVPPDVLFHGTSPSSVGDIQSSGLLPMGRQYVHLSTDFSTASAVGKRKSGDPVILQILAKRASEAGVQFYLGNDKVWLADFVPVEFIEFDN